MKSVVEDNLEAAIDIFSKSISGDKLTDQQLDALTNIPIVKNITAIARFYGSIREASTVKKIVKFIETLQKGHLDKECYERLKKKYGDEKILEEVLFRIDRMRSVAHVKIQAHLYRALLEEEITWDRFIQICDAVEQLSVVDIDKEIERLLKEHKRLEGEIARSNGMLNNEKFVSKAPAAKINEEKEKLAKYTEMMKQVEEQLGRLKKN